ncbi:MAG TPA: phenylalanine--tRNA ligase subunit beta [Nitriliruptorales bacterium]
MKVPLSWLLDFVDVSHLSVDDLIDVMSLNGLEVEEVHAPGRGTLGVRTKRVVSWGPHPDADKLRVVTVTDGTEQIELVCGASNFDTGDIVAHAEVGATIPAQGGAGEPFELEARELRGVVSNGMLCSARELQLGDDHSGIMVLPPDTPLGVSLTQVLPVGEPVIEVAVLADRGDHHCILGLAREVAAILGIAHRVPQPAWSDDPSDVQVDIAGAAGGCAHFVTRVVEDVTVGPSPWWLRQRLIQCGIRPINNVVDVTNLVMLELGQPLHAFDLDTVHGRRVEVRWALEGETLVTLDGAERALLGSDLIIADADRIVSLAGVMGGADTEVAAGTTTVLLEGAIWDPGTIRRTSRRLNLISEASLRFERRVDPAGARRAVTRAAELLVELAGGTLGGVAEDGAPGGPGEPVEVDAAWVARFLGLDDLPPDAQADYLRRLGCEVDVRGAGLTVTPPSWRGDLVRPADIAEEVARLYGLDNVPSTLPPVLTRGGLSVAQKAERRVREAALAGGFHEVRTWPFVGRATLQAVVPTDGRVGLENPLAQDAATMTPSLVEALLQVVRRNVGQQRPGVAIFELARIFRPAGDPVEESLKGFGDGWIWRDPEGRSLPTQPRTLGLAAQGLRLGEGWLDEGETWSVYDLLAVFDEVVRRLAPPDDPSWTLERLAVERDGMHPGRTAALHVRGVEIGLVGQLHPNEADARDLPEPVVVGELLLEPLLGHLEVSPEPIQARPLTRHAAMTIDVALQAPVTVPFAELRTAIREGAGELLDEHWVFDEYRGEQLGEGQRSIAVRLRLQSPDRQLTDEDAEQVIQAIAERAGELGATLRR